MLPKDLTLEQIESVLCAKDFKEYAKSAWRVVDPQPLVWGWHMDAIGEHLEAVSAGQIDNLLINCPPGFSKSLQVSVLWPTWEWTSRPEGRWLSASYDQQLSTRDAVRSRHLLLSSWYQRRWGYAWKMSGDQSQKTRYENDRRGWRIATSITGLGTGEHPDRVVIDDPEDAAGVRSDAERQRRKDWWTQTMASRGVSVDRRTVAVMQRLHEDDFSAQVLAEGGFVHLMLPMEFEPERRFVTVLGWTDPRRKAGELLDSKRFPPDVVENLKRVMGAHTAAGQLQQRPSSAEGGAIKRKWLTDHVYNVIPAELDQTIQSWDLTFKDAASSDYVVGQVWGRKGADLYLLDQVRDRLDAPGTIAVLKSLSAKWPNATAKLIEDAANGPAVIALLRHTLTGIIPIKVNNTGKAARLQAVAPLMEAGNVHLPANAQWAHDLIEELAAFPNGANDDQCDAMSQALSWLMAGAMAKTEQPVPHLDPVQARARELTDARAERKRTLMQQESDEGESRFDY